MGKHRWCGSRCRPAGQHRVEEQQHPRHAEDVEDQVRAGRPVWPQTLPTWQAMVAVMVVPMFSPSTTAAAMS